MMFEPGRLGRQASMPIMWADLPLNYADPIPTPGLQACGLSFKLVHPGVKPPFGSVRCNIICALAANRMRRDASTTG